MTRAYEKFPELLEAKRNDLRQLTEDKIDKILESQQSNHQTSFSDFKNEAISSKSVFGFISKSSKQLLSLLNSNSKVKKSKSPDDNKLNAIIENQKILASLIVKIGRNQNQLNEIVNSA